MSQSKGHLGVSAPRWAWCVRQLFCITCLFWSVTGYAASDQKVSSPAATPMPTPTKTILVWGDSLSAAYGFDQKLGWPTLLNDRLITEGLSYQVVNGSVSGETTAGGLARFPRALQTHAPSIVLLALGANDGLRALPTTAMQQQLGEMISLAQAQGAQVLLFEMKVPPNYGPRYAQAFEAVYHALIKETDAILLPFFLLDVVLKPDLMQADNLHPTAKAQPLLLERVWAGLEQML